METRVGQVTHYYNRIGVAVIRLEGELKVGDGILIIGHTTDFMQLVKSMEINHHPIQAASDGDTVALKVWDSVRRGDVVFRLAEHTSLETAEREPLHYAG